MAQGQQLAVGAPEWHPLSVASPVAGETLSRKCHPNVTIVLSHAKHLENNTAKLMLKHTSPPTPHTHHHIHPSPHPPVTTSTYPHIHGPIPTATYPFTLSHLHMGSSDSSVVRVPDLSSKGHRFESQQSAGSIFFSRVNFLCRLLFRYPFHTCVTAVAHNRSQTFCQKCRWQVTAKHACTPHTWLCMK